MHVTEGLERLERLRILIFGRSTARRPAQHFSLEGFEQACTEVGLFGRPVQLLIRKAKELLGIGESLVGRLLLYDALQARVSTVSYGWDPESPLNGRNPRFKDLSHHRQEVVGSKG